ncbi:MAG: type II secretion system minor pseudopilin GspK [Mariprofundus sp.]|nr:type II secretion system minor pseudopilin GspK [Mariprofundus sp.]
MIHQHQSQHQRGAALIIVLGLVALISTWAIDAIYEDNIALRRAENSYDALRAAQASQSALILSAKILTEDSKESQSDDLDEIWAQQTDAFPIDDGTVQGSIIDANRFLNLNDLVDKNGVVKAAVEAYAKALFTQLDLDTGLVDALIDWMDSDTQTHGAGGAEDASYYNQDYHVKNARLDRWDELLLIRGFNLEILAALSDVAIIRNVPSNDISSPNINTMSAQVLMSLTPDISAADADTFISERPFTSVQQALKNRSWAVKINAAYLSVVSDVFMVRTQANFGRARLRETFMLQRQAGKITLHSLQRSRNYRAPVQEE